MKKQVKSRIRKDENGTALVTAIFAILLGTLIAVALYHHTMTMMTISVNNRDSTEALYLADAGVNHASKLIGKLGKNKYSSILTNGANPTPDTGDELSTPPASGGWTTAESIAGGNNAGGGVTLGAGRYFVALRNDTATGETATTDNNGILIIKATGIGRNGATSTIEATIKSTAIALPGILSNGDARFNNPLKVLGPGGTIQINGEARFGGTGRNACAEQKFEIMTASIPYSDLRTGPLCNTAPVEGTSILFNQPRAIPPIIDVAKLRSEFKPKATLVFKDDGEIYRQIGGIEGTIPLSVVEKLALGLHEWGYDSLTKQWDHKIDTRLPDGNYYFWNTNVKISKGGDSINPPKVTLFVEGYISLNNAIALQPNLVGYAMVTANDISMSSRYSLNTNPGLVYAYGQISFSNVTFIYGSLIAADFYLADGTFGPDANAPGGSNLVSGANGAMQVSGDTTIITTDAGSAIGAIVVNWREVRQ